MRSDNPQQHDRRTFFRVAAQSAAAGALGAVGLVLGHRALNREQPCINDNVCRHCSISGTCSLPPALSYRHVTGGDRAAQGQREAQS